MTVSLRNLIPVLSKSRCYQVSSTTSHFISNSLVRFNNSNMSVFERGLFTLRVPMELHNLNRKRLVEELRKVPSLKGKTAVVILQGGPSTTRYCSDHEPLFRQESYFHWTFGVQEPDFLGAVNIATGKSFLFAPRLPESYAVWMGKLATLSDIKSKYEVDECFYVDQVRNAYGQNCVSQKCH